MASQTQTISTRSSGNLPIALLLLGSGALLWIRAALRDSDALVLLPGAEGCLTAGIVGVLLALLHGIPYRTALLSIAAPLVLVQVLASELAGSSFLPVVGIELTALGLFGLPLSRLPRRRAAATRPVRSLREAPPSPS
ncbi:hypothetical protein [Sorangium sp. So ce887]|uniref:hypothetical protein n=1 Tax=Sorangium sp. So ce887 TaxID=3133324 RepID=UPI003F5DA7CB